MADTSFYTKAAPAQNPLAMMAQMMQIQQLGNQNKLFQQEFADKAGINQVFNQAPLDPVTGMPDTAALAKGAQGAGLGRLLPTIMDQIQNMKSKQLQIDTSQLDIAKKMFDATAGQMSALANKPDLGSKDITETFLGLQKKGLLNPQQTAAYLMEIPPGDDPKALQGWVTQKFLIPTLDAKSKIDFQFGQNQMLDTGGAFQPGAQMPGGAFKAAGSAIQKTLDPATATSPTQMMTRNPDGTMTPSVVTRSQFANLSKQGPVATGAPLSAEGLSPEALNSPKTWYDPAKKQNVTGTLGQFLEEVGQKYKLGTPEDGGKGGTGGPVPAAPALGAETAANTAAKTSAEEQQALLKSASESSTRVMQLQEASKLLQDTKTGKGTESVNAIRSYLVSALGDSPLAREVEVASYDKLGKYLQQNANAMSKSLGTGSDAQLAAVVSGNPNRGLNTLANRELVQVGIGLERMLQVKAMLGADKDPQEYSKWSAQFGTSVDPRAFVIDLLPQDKQNKLREQVLKGNENERRKFINSYDLASRMFGGQQ